MDEHERRLLNEIYAADDKWRAEHEAWLARRKAERAQARKTDASGLLHRTSPDNEPPPAPEPDADGWQGWEQWMRGHLDNEREVVAQAIGEVAAVLRKEWQDEFKDAIAKRDAEIANLRGQVDMLVRMLGGGKTADIVEVGKGIVRKVRGQ
jgi:hypothetical protein